MKCIAAIAALIIAVLLGGCASASIELGNAAPAPGTSVNSAAIRAEVSHSPYFGLLFLGVFAARVQDDYLSWHYGGSWRNPPQLAADREVVERDCSRPMPAPSANLRCK